MIFSSEIGGGLLIGLASALPLLWEGRIAGVSGYASSSLRQNSAEAKTALLFVMGLIVGAFIWKFAGGAIPDKASSTMSLALWVLSGLLLGFGSRMGGGCTSGHGVCGLGRLSPRSLISVLIFMSTAMLTQLLIRGLE